MYNEILQIFKENPNCRERRVRWKVISKILKDKYPNELGNVDLARIWDIVSDGMTADRDARDIQFRNEELRGEDWADGKALSQEEAIKRGAEVGFNEDIKLSKKI